MVAVVTVIVVVDAVTVEVAPAVVVSAVVGVGVGVAIGVGVDTGVGVAVAVDITRVGVDLANCAGGATSPLQPTNSISAAVTRSSGMSFNSFMSEPLTPCLQSPEMTFL